MQLSAHISVEASDVGIADARLKLWHCIALPDAVPQITYASKVHGPRAALPTSQGASHAVAAIQNSAPAPRTVYAMKLAVLQPARCQCARIKPAIRQQRAKNRKARGGQVHVMGHWRRHEDVSSPDVLWRSAGLDGMRSAGTEDGVDASDVTPGCHHGGEGTPVIFEELLNILRVLFFHDCADSNGVGPVCFIRIGKPGWRFFHPKFYIVPTKMSGYLACFRGGCMAYGAPHSAAMAGGNQRSALWHPLQQAKQR